MQVFGYGIETQPQLGALFPKATYVVTEPELAAKSINASPSSKVAIKYTFCDTENSAPRSISCAKQAASPTGCNGQPCDVAFDAVDLSDNLSVPLLAKEGFAIVGGSVNSDQAYDTPNLFCLTSGTQALETGMGYVFKTLGAKKVGILNLLRPSVQEDEADMVNGLKVQGLTVAGTKIVPSTTVSPNASIDAVMTGGADGLLDAVVGPVGPAIKYAEQTYPGVKLGFPAYMIAPSFFTGLPASSFNGIGVTSWSQPTTATKVPGVAQFRAEGGIAAGGAYKALDFTLQAWLATHFIANVANKISGPITKASMVQAFRTAENVDMYGILPPWSASNRGKDGAKPCSPYNVVVDEKLENDAQVADNPGQFVNQTTGKVAYVDPGGKSS